MPGLGTREEMQSLFEPSAGRRRSRVERNSNLFQIHTGLSLRLVRINLGPKGTDIAKLLVAEGLARWEDSSVAPPSRAATTLAASAAASGFLPCPDDLDAGELKVREERVKAKLDKLCKGLGVSKMKLAIGKHPVMP